jgi:hypothetical protein
MLAVENAMSSEMDNPILTQLVASCSDTTSSKDKFYVLLGKIK